MRNVHLTRDWNTLACGIRQGLAVNNEAQVTCPRCRRAIADPDEWIPTYEPWRHGGWYVTNIRYPSGACGCVSRNFSDKKWRIVCSDAYVGSPNDRTFKDRDSAARAERELAMVSP